MNPRLTFAALVAFCCLNSIAGQTSVKVDVFYESLCPDSIYFITKELGPVYNQFKQFIDVTLVPFGKASWTGSEGQARFTCQHGPAECEGNRAQACALHEIQQTIGADEQQQKMVEIVDCAMARSGYASAVPQCATDKGLSTESVERIRSCTNSALGNELLIAQGKKTQAVESRLSFVPTILINGEKTSKAFRNFSATICEKLADNEKPEICSHVHFE